MTFLLFCFPFGIQVLILELWQVWILLCRLGSALSSEYWDQSHVPCLLWSLLLLLLQLLILILLILFKSLICREGKNVLKRSSYHSRSYSRWQGKVMVKTQMYDCKAKPVTIHTPTSVFNPCCSGHSQLATLGMKMNSKLTQDRENLEKTYSLCLKCSDKSWS